MTQIADDVYGVMTWSGNMTVASNIQNHLFDKIAIVEK